MNDWATEQAECALAAWRAEGREINQDLVEAVATALRDAYETGIGDGVAMEQGLLTDKIETLERQLAAERERCAGIAENAYLVDVIGNPGYEVRRKIADAIRKG